MAKLLETFRSSIIDSIKGRKIGLDNAGYLVGIPDVAKAVEDLTTVATTVIGYGVSRVTASGSTQGPVQYTLPAPVPGVDKHLVLTSTSTASYQFGSTANGASIFNATAGTTVGWINLIGPGGSVVLTGVSTSVWVLKSVVGSTATNYPTFSTST